MNSNQELAHEKLCSNYNSTVSSPRYMTPSVIKMVKQEPTNDCSSQEEKQFESILDNERRENPISGHGLEKATYEVSSEDGTTTSEREEPQKPNNVVVNHAIGKKQSRKFSCTQRNAWGNFSYADLITRAIMSSPNKRMTLQEIYAWISDNIPYFMDKKDGPTTTGWKNSVRHTLSIRKRFIRLPNIAFGSLNYKSDWMVDPYAEARRRNSSSYPLNYQAESQRMEMADWSQQLRVSSSRPHDRATQTEFPNTSCPYCRHLVSLNSNIGTRSIKMAGYQN